MRDIFYLMNTNSKIKEMVENGFSNKKISIVLNIDNSYVKSYVKANNFEIKKEQFSDDKIDHIISLYAQGVSAKKLGIKYSIDKRRIQKWAKENNILRSKNESHRITFFNESIFDVIDSPQKAYWLGFFYADAYNNEKSKSISICLSSKDKDHLIKLASFLNFPKSKIIDGFTELNNKKYPTSTLKLYSKHMCNTLNKQGCPQAKSFIIKYPTFLQKKLNVYFIRGLFDGDGSLCMSKCNNEWKFKLVSTKECLFEIQQIIYKYTNILTSYSCISKTNNNTYEMVCCGNEQVLNIMNWLYKGANVINDCVLNRKYEKFIELHTQQNNRFENKTINRGGYFISDEIKQAIIESIKNNESTTTISKKYNVHRVTVNRYKNEFYK